MSLLGDICSIRWSMCLCHFFVSGCMFCLLRYLLVSVPLQLIAWEDLPPKSPVIHAKPY